MVILNPEVLSNRCHSSYLFTHGCPLNPKCFRNLDLICIISSGTRETIDRGKECKWLLSRQSICLSITHPAGSLLTNPESINTWLVPTYKSQSANHVLNLEANESEVNATEMGIQRKRARSNRRFGLDERKLSLIPWSMMQIVMMTFSSSHSNPK